MKALADGLGTPEVFVWPKEKNELDKLCGGEDLDLLWILDLALETLIGPQELPGEDDVALELFDCVDSGERQLEWKDG